MIDDCEICPRCSGSGEGVADTRCDYCGGCGQVTRAKAQAWGNEARRWCPAAPIEGRCPQCGTRLMMRGAVCPNPACVPPLA